MKPDKSKLLFEIEINAAQARSQAEDPKVWFDLLSDVYDLQPIEFTDLGGEG